jgi:hypothetical protein
MVPGNNVNTIDLLADQEHLCSTRWAWCTEASTLGGEAERRSVDQGIDKAWWLDQHDRWQEVSEAP